MPKSIRNREAEVHAAFERALTLANGDEPQTLASFEATLWTSMLALGRALVGLFLAREAARLRPTKYVWDRVAYVLDRGSPRSTELGTRFGKVSFTRPVGRRSGYRSRWAVDLPVDRDLGLIGGFSLQTVTSIAYLCTLLAFETARRTYATFCEWKPSSRAVLRMVDAVGGKARAFLEATPAPDDDGEILVIQVDGRGAPMISTTEYERRTKKRARPRGTRRHARRDRRRENPRQRRNSGERSKNAKNAVLGIVYTLRRTRDGLEGPINKRIIGTFDGHGDLFRWLVVEAKKRGYGKKRTIFLADGCRHIWRYQQECFPDVEVCLDWYHVVERLWEVSEILYGISAEKAEVRSIWVARQTRRLRQGRPRLIVAELDTALSKISKTGPGNKGKRTRLRRSLGFFIRNQHRMPYDVFRDDDLDIGTGAAEGAVRNVVGVRLDGPGMRWGRERAELILQLRCILASDLWPQFAQYLASHAPRLLPQPIRTCPHDAKSRAPQPQTESVAA